MTTCLGRVLLCGLLVAGPRPVAIQPQLHQPTPAERKLARVVSLGLVGLVGIWGISQAAHHR